MAEFTKDEKAHINFFGNAVEVDMQIEELKVYLEEVHNFIKITHVNLQSNKVIGLDTETLENLKYHFEHTQGEILRKSIIISTVILLENAIDEYCKTFKEYGKLKIGYGELRGDLLSRFKIFSSKILNSNFDFQSTLWQDVKGLYEIRNSLVHNYGLVSDFGKRKTVDEFVKRNRSFEIDDNDRICISHKACLDSIEIVWSFYTEITDFALGIFPKPEPKQTDGKPPF